MLRPYTGSAELRLQPQTTGQASRVGPRVAGDIFPHPPRAGREMTGERGLTLLEVLVALVVLTLVGLGYLQLFQQSHRLVADSREWSAAVMYAQDAMERAKLGSLSRGAPAESLPGGFRREITRRPWQLGGAGGA